MSQAPNICISPSPIYLLGTLIITGTIAFSLAGLPGEANAIKSFSHSRISNYRTMGSVRSRTISNSGSTYLMDDIKDTDREYGYLHLDQRELRSIINIIADYPSLEKMSNDTQKGSNLPKISMYEIMTNGSIINMRQGAVGALTVGDAYTTSGYTELGLPSNPIIRTQDEIEVMAMAQEVKQLAQELHDLSDKIDTKVGNLDKDMVAKLDKLDAKIDKNFDKLTEISNKLSDKVSVINTEVAVINTKIDSNNTFKEKFQIPLLVALIVVLANHLPDIIKVLSGTPKP